MRPAAPAHDDDQAQRGEQPQRVESRPLSSESQPSRPVVRRSQRVAPRDVGARDVGEPLAALVAGLRPAVRDIARDHATRVMDRAIRAVRS